MPIVALYVFAVIAMLDVLSLGMAWDDRRHAQCLREMFEVGPRSGEQDFGPLLEKLEFSEEQANRRPEWPLAS